MRYRIMKSIMENPKNANQLSVEAGVNYRTIEHHLKILTENGLLTVMGDGYGKVYFPSHIMESNLDLFVDISRKAGYMEENS